MSPVLYQLSYPANYKQITHAIQHTTRCHRHRSSFVVSYKMLRGWDLNPRPRGYEPRELPDCSTPLCSILPTTTRLFVQYTRDTSKTDEKSVLCSISSTSQLSNKCALHQLYVLEKVLIDGEDATRLIALQRKVLLMHDFVTDRMRLFQILNAHELRRCERCEPLPHVRSFVSDMLKHFVREAIRLKDGDFIVRRIFALQSFLDLLPAMCIFPL